MLRLPCARPQTRPYARTLNLSKGLPRHKVLVFSALRHRLRLPQGRGDPCVPDGGRRVRRRGVARQQDGQVGGARQGAHLLRHPHGKMDTGQTYSHVKYAQKPVSSCAIPSFGTLGHSDGFTHPTRLYPLQRPATGHSFGCVNLSRIMQPRILAFVGLNTHGINQLQAGNI